MTFNGDEATKIIYDTFVVTYNNLDNSFNKNHEN